MPLLLDASTLLLVAGMLSLLIGVLFLIVAPHHDPLEATALRWIGASHFGTMLACTMFYPMMQTRHPPLTVSLGYGGLLLMCALYLIGVQRLRGEMALAPQLTALAIPGLWGIAALLASDTVMTHPTPWMVVFGTLFCGYAFLIVRQLLKLRAPGGHALVLAAVWTGFGMGCLGRMLRGGWEGWIPAIRQPDAITVLVTLCCSIIGAYGLMAVVKQRADATLKRLATTDALTSAMNRRGFEQRAGQALSRLAARGAPVAVLMCDLDHFKQVNDRYGHQAGDRLLTLFADTALRTLRSVDLFGRMGGEEFVALLPGVVRAEDAHAVAERIRAAYAATTIPLAGQRIGATVTIGVVFARQAPPNLVTLLSPADRALYDAKRHGRNQIVSVGFSHA